MLFTKPLSNDSLANRTELELDAYRRKCKKWWPWSTPLPFISLVVAFFIGSEVSKYLQVPLQYIHYVLFPFAIAGGLVGLKMYFWVVNMENDLKRLELLDPLKGDLCVRALTMVNMSPSAKEWADNVIRQGRQLRKFDFDEIETRFKSDTLDSQQLRNVAAYKTLHGEAA